MGITEAIMLTGWSMMMGEAIPPLLQAAIVASMQRLPNISSPNNQT
jgi:hypothetical protein